MTDWEPANWGLPKPFVSVCPYCLQKVELPDFHECPYWDHLEAIGDHVYSKETGRRVI